MPLLMFKSSSLIPHISLLDIFTQSPSPLFVFIINHSLIQLIIYLLTYLITCLLIHSFNHLIVCSSAHAILHPIPCSLTTFYFLIPSSTNPNPEHILFTPMHLLIITSSPLIPLISLLNHFFASFLYLLPLIFLLDHFFASFLHLLP
jgi:hypothetical protein